MGEAPRGSARGWSVIAKPPGFPPAGWRWHAWCNGESRTGVVGSQSAAEALAQSALDELVNDARRRGMRSVV